MEHDIFHINHLNALNHQEQRKCFHKYKNEGTFFLLCMSICFVLPQNKVITLQVSYEDKKCYALKYVLEINYQIAQKLYMNYLLF